MIDHEPVEIHPTITWMDEGLEPDEDRKFGIYGYATIGMAVIDITKDASDYINNYWENKCVEGLAEKIIADKINPPIGRKKIDEDLPFIYTTIGCAILDNKRVILGDFE